MKKVLHIAPHFGGGVGQVLGNIALASSQYSNFEHEFIFLDCLGEESLKNIEKYSLVVYQFREIEDRVTKADIVQIEWWNHPLLSKFLCDFPMPLSRLLLYSHISGIYYPNILTKEIINYPDLFVASTEYSLKSHPLLHTTAATNGQKKACSIHSCSGLSRVESVRKKKHRGFNVGYIGTLDFSKLHPDFVKMSAAANLPNVRFSICGIGNDYDVICKQIGLTGVANRFQMYGYVEDIASIFSTMDVLGYPLNSCHYGTGEQVIIESLGAGVPVIVMNNGCETTMIRHGYNGMIVNSPEEYSRCIEFLAENPELVAKMGRNAKEYAQKNFSIQNIIHQFDSLYNNLIKEPKIDRKPIKGIFPGVSGDCTYFLSSLENYSQHYIESITLEDLSLLLIADRKIAQENVLYTSNSKGTIFQYRRYFADDPFLAFWCGLVMLEKGNYEAALMSFSESIQLGFKHWRIYWYSWCARLALNEEFSKMNISRDILKRAENASEELSGFFGEKFTNELLENIKVNLNKSK